MEKTTTQIIRRLGILDVADRLHLKYSSQGVWRKALCFCHDDHTPSLGLNTATNKWKCFSCGKGGSNIDLVMEHEGLAFNDACEWLIREFNIPVPQHETRKSLINSFKEKLMNLNNDNDTLHYDNDNPISPQLSTLNSQLLDRFKGISNTFTRALVNSGILTTEQMRHAAEVFRLSTVDDSVIFWQIDRDNHIREGKVMHYQADGHRSHSHKPVTVSWLLKQQKQLPAEWKAQHCLFGLHQLRPSQSSLKEEDTIVAIVESEKTAIICSELLPTLPMQEGSGRVVWLATGGKSNLSVQALQPVLGHRVILFPDTDTTGECYKDWFAIARQANDSLNKSKASENLSITVSPLLERHATPDQKARKIDIADFILEGR